LILRENLVSDWDCLQANEIVNFFQNRQFDMFFVDPRRHLIGQIPQLYLTPSIDFLGESPFCTVSR
jgi:hypothetical protein